MPAKKPVAKPKSSPAAKPVSKPAAAKASAPAKRHIVCLTFDCDGIAGPIARGQASPAALSRGEFGMRAGIPRILELLKRYDVKGTWFVAGHAIETFPRQCEPIVAAGHEIAHHGWTHRPLGRLTREQEEAELARGNASIKWLTGHNARGFRSPSRDLSAHSVDLLLKHGFAYDSSLAGDGGTPYFARTGDIIELERKARFGQETALVEMPVSGPADAGQGWSDELAYMAQWGVLTFTCNPAVAGRGANMAALENFIKSAIGDKAVFMTAEAAVAEFKARGADTSK